MECGCTVYFGALSRAENSESKSKSKSKSKIKSKIKDKYLKLIQYYNHHFKTAERNKARHLKL